MIVAFGVHLNRAQSELVACQRDNAGEKIQLLAVLFLLLLLALQKAGRTEGSEAADADLHKERVHRVGTQFLEFVGGHGGMEED